MGVSADRARRTYQMTGVNKSSAAFYPLPPHAQRAPASRKEVDTRARCVVEET